MVDTKLFERHKSYDRSTLFTGTPHVSSDIWNQVSNLTLLASNVDLALSQSFFAMAQFNYFSRPRAQPTLPKKTCTQM